MKEAPKSAGIVCKIGIDPVIDEHCNPGQILLNFYVKNIFLAQILAELEHFHWQPSWTRTHSKNNPVWLKID